MMSTADTAASTVVDDGASPYDAPIRDTLLRLGYLTDDQSAKVRDHAEANHVDFDQAALELGFITVDDLDRARETLINSLALQHAPARQVSDELVVLSDPASLKAEAIRLLRTQVIAQHIKPGRRALAVVSPIDGVGCSYIAANLAASLSQVGIKTLLIDANMRSPRMDQFFGLDANAPGLSTYLTLQAPRPERVVHANVLPNLSVVTAGPPVPRPQELLSSARFRDGANVLLREYDIAIFDTPPASTSADALTIAAAAGYALMVARRDASYTRDLTMLTNQLASARSAVIGSVLNEF